MLGVEVRVAGRGRVVSRVGAVEVHLFERGITRGACQAECDRGPVGGQEQQADAPGEVREVAGRLVRLWLERRVLDTASELDLHVLAPGQVPVDVRGPAALIDLGGERFFPRSRENPCEGRASKRYLQAPGSPLVRH